MEIIKKEELEKYIRSSSNMSEVLRKLGIYPSYRTREFLKRKCYDYQLNVPSAKQVRSKIMSTSKDDIEKIVTESNTLSEVLFKLDVNTNNGKMMNKLKERCYKENIDISKFDQPVGWRKGHSNRVYSLDEILVENSKYKCMSRLKKRLLDTGLFNNICYICNMEPIWNEKKLVLQIDHINGNSRDHRLENLRLLCPNCHSQTSTFCRR